MVLQLGLCTINVFFWCARQSVFMYIFVFINIKKPFFITLSVTKEIFVRWGVRSGGGKKTLHGGIFFFYRQGDLEQCCGAG